jgi:hypothetical protein
MVTVKAVTRCQGGLNGFRKPPHLSLPGKGCVIIPAMRLRKKLADLKYLLR